MAKEKEWGKDRTLWDAGINCHYWAQSCGMKVDAKKCYILSICGKSKHYYSLDNIILQQVPSNAYLGITIAEDLRRLMVLAGG
jgi:hypothetical protein